MHAREWHEFKRCLPVVAVWAGMTSAEVRAARDTWSGDPGPITECYRAIAASLARR